MSNLLDDPKHPLNWQHEYDKKLYGHPNKAWMRHEDGSYSAEASTLDANGTPWRDPWGRSLEGVDVRVHRDTEGTAYWNFVLDGTLLTVFND